MNFKKFTACVAVGVLLSTSACAMAFATSYKTYTPGNEIIVTVPTDGYETQAGNISILGACNPRNQLYINGELIEITESGFFADYVTLEDGKNIFELKNGNKKKIITVVKNASSMEEKIPQVAEDAGNITEEIHEAQPQKVVEPPSNEDLYDETITPIYGVVNRDNISHRARPDESNVLLTPLVKGTTTQIIGETGAYYRIYDGTYIYKETLEVKEGTLEKNKITHVFFEPEAEKNTMELGFNMDYAALYSLSADKEKMILTIFNTDVLQPSDTTMKNLYLKDVTAVQDGENAVYTISFADDVKISGSGVRFDKRTLLLSFKKVPTIQEYGTLKGAKIVIDAGHGGSDVGAIGPAGTNGPMEKDINLQIALATRDYLEDLGAEVIMTRSDDTFVSLGDRVETICREIPDLSISIHGNSAPVTTDYTKASGFLTFYTYEDMNDAVSFMNTNVAGLMHFSGSAPRQSNLALTRITDCPAVLFESKFLSNPQDYEWLIQAENQKTYGEAIGRATQKYIERIASYQR